MCITKKDVYASKANQIQKRGPIATRPVQRRNSLGISPINSPWEYAKKYRPGLGGVESPVSPVGFVEPHFGGSSSSQSASPASSTMESLLDKYEYSRLSLEAVDDPRCLPQVHSYDSPAQGMPVGRAPYDRERPETRFPTPYIRQPTPPRLQLKSRLSRPPPVPRIPAEAGEAAPRHKRTHGHADSPRKYNPRVDEVEDRHHRCRHHHHQRGEGEEHHGHRRHHHAADEKHHRRPRDDRTPIQRVSRSKSTREAIRHVREEYELRPWAKTIKNGILSMAKNAKELKATVMPGKDLFSYDVGEKHWKNEKFR